MYKYCAMCSKKGMEIHELNEIALNNRCPYEKARGTFDSVKVYDTIDDCIKSLGSYTKPVKIFDGRTVIPDAVNFPRMAEYYCLKPVLFPLCETIA